jgi:hypothetical protein
MTNPKYPKVIKNKGFSLIESPKEIIYHRNNIIVVDKQTNNLIGYY